MKALDLLVAAALNPSHSASSLLNPSPLYTSFQNADITLWAIMISSIVCVSVSLGSFWYFRKKHQQTLEEWKTKVSSDLHDDVGSKLCALAMQAELLESKVDTRNKETARKIAAMSRQAMGQMRDTVWAIDARKNNWASLVDRLNEHAFDTLQPRGIQFDLQTQGIDLEKSMDPTVRQNLYLIGKEAITNVVRHSSATKVTMQLNQSQTDFAMTIEDNGNFSENANKPKGLGLSNMYLRAKNIQAQLKISADAGFRVCLVGAAL
jgi:signal transduction histidine kinase